MQIRRHLSTAIAAIVGAIVVASLAVAQSPGLGIKKNDTLTGTGSSGSPLGVNTTTLASTGLTAASSTTLAVNTTTIQARVSGSCSAGSSIRVVDSAGAVTCETDDNTTYTAGTPITLTGTTFDIAFSSDFQDSAGSLDLSTAVTAPGTINAATNITTTDGHVRSTVTSGSPSLVVGTSSKTWTLYPSGNDLNLYEYNTTLEAGGGNIRATFAAGGLLTATAGLTTPANVTTTGTGALVVAGTATIGGVLDVDSSLAKFGATDGGTYIGNESISFEYTVNALATGYVNWRGYQNGTTQFRDMVFGTGKAVEACRLTGSTSILNCVGGLQENGSAVLSGAISDNRVPKGSSGNLADSSIIDDGTTVSSAENAWFGFDNAAGSISVGDAYYSTVAADIGFSIGGTGANMFWATKMNTGGNLLAYVGAGAQSGASTLWLTVTGSNGNAAFGAAGSFVGNLSTDANLTAGNATTDSHTINGGTIVYDTVGTTLSTTAGLEVRDDTAFSAGNGGQIALLGKYTAGGAYVHGAAIKAFKTNGTDGNASYDLGFATFNGSALTERMRITDQGQLQLNGGAATVLTGKTAGIVNYNGGVLNIAAQDASINTAVKIYTSNTADAAARLIVASTGAIRAGDAADVAVADNVDVFTIANTGTAQTTSNALIRGAHSGTFNTTAAELVVVGNDQAMTNTVSSGSNLLYVFGVRGKATGNNANTYNVGVFGYCSSATSACVGMYAEAAGTDDQALRVDGTAQTWFTDSLIVSRGTKPTLSSCGTSPTMNNGTAQAGTFTTGTGATACTVTFDLDFGAAPSCVVTARSGTQPAYSTAFDALTLSTAAASAIYDYVCFETAVASVGNLSSK